jgi:DNA-binding NtrC family response regulator
MNILLVDDHYDTCETLARFLRKLGHDVKVCHSGDSALQEYSQGSFPMVLSDIRMPGMSGITLLQAIKSLPSGQDSDVILMTGHGGMESAIQAMRAGAYDYLLKPVNIEELALLTDRIVEHRKLQTENRHLRDEVQEVAATAENEIQRLTKLAQASAGMPEFGLFSAPMLAVAQRCLQYHMDRSVPVLIQGETGTGKELAARLIHYGNMTPQGVFVDVNCAALTASLFESELFGYEAGSFTGGLSKGRKGKLDLAAGGTLFLDEIGDMPTDLQAKLLRVLEQREYYRVGGLEKIKADVRFICATHEDLAQRVQAGSFREDLYFRLRVGTIRLPSLRERPEDILPLARLFLDEAAKTKKKRFENIGSDAAELLLQHTWPGNVRELRNVIEAAVVLYDEKTLLPGHLFLLSGDKERQVGAPVSEAGSGKDTRTVKSGVASFTIPTQMFSLEELNHGILERTLNLFDGNLTQAARHLGLSPRTLSYRLKTRKK